MAITDESKMPWGKHKGEMMINVPAQYLLWLYDNNKCSLEIREYINKNMEVLLKEARQRDY